jgi:hypothetical protein
MHLPTFLRTVCVPTLRKSCKMAWMRSRLLPLLALAALSCRKVPATLPEPAGEPAAEDPAPTQTRVFVEAQPDTAETRLFEPISNELASLYSCWFESPYPYMFEARGEPLEIHGQSYDMLMAGIRGILYYGDFNECAGRLVGQQPRSYSDIGPIEALAGMSATLPSSNLPFRAVNPEIIAWARTQLLPAPQQSIEGVPVQLAYDRVFRRFFRLMGESLFWLLEQGTLASETAPYLSAVDQGRDGLEWLEARYPAIPSHGGSWDGTTMTAPMAAGFWLRRELDGSFAACWHGLREVLERYDANWLGELRASYPQAANALAQIPDPLASEGVQP